MQSTDIGERSTTKHHDLLWVVVGSVALVAITCLPYVAAIAMTPPGQQFMGFLWGVDEGNVYLQWMRQARDGHFVFFNQYTSKPQNPHFFNVFFLALGLIARLTGWKLIIVFHLARVVGGVFLLWAFYLLVCELTQRRAVQLGAVLLASLSSGLGWIFVLRAQNPPSSYYRPRFFPVDVAAGWQAQPEAVTFLSLFLNPLFVVAMGLLCLVMLFGVRAVRRGWGSTVACGLALLLLGNIHGYDIFVCFGTLFVWFLLNVLSHRLGWWQAALRYVAIALICLPAPLWAWYTAHVDPAYREKINTLTASARPIDYAIGYGLPLALAVLGTGYVLWRWRASRTEASGRDESPPALLLPVIWLIVNAPALYLPVSFQRKLAEGMHLPICILAAVGAVYVIVPLLRGRLSPAVVLALVALLSLPSNILFVTGCLRHAAVNNRDLLDVLQPPMYLTTDELQAIAYLGRSTVAADLVMSSSLTGSHIPPRAPCRVYAGHWAETLEFGRALRGVSLFFTPGQSPELKWLVLKTTGTTLVFYGPRERIFQQALARRIDPSGKIVPANEDPAAGLTKLAEVYKNRSVTIYRVVPSPIRRSSSE